MATSELYTVLSPHYEGYDWFPIAHQTWDYCHGFFDASRDRHLVIVNEQHVVLWPEERRGEQAIVWTRSARWLADQAKRRCPSGLEPYILLEVQPSVAIDSEVGYELYG